MTLFTRYFLISLPTIAAAILLAGCSTNNTTNPARSATEQLLLSTATDHALGTADLRVFTNQKVFLDTNYFDSYDSKYALGTIRDALSRGGARLEDNVTNCDLVIEARSGALSTDTSDFLIGIPSIGVPIPLAGTVQTPELALYKSEIQNSTAKIALLAYARESKAHVYSSGPMDGKSRYNHFKLLFISWISTDIPEKYSGRKMEKHQTWFPQSDLEHMIGTNTTKAYLPPPATTNAASSR